MWILLTTGGAFRAMRFGKAVMLALILETMTGGVQAQKATATVTLNVTFVNPSCDITVPDSYNLGTLTLGSKEHEDLKIIWHCASEIPLKTALMASIVTGVPQGDDKIRLIVGNKSSGTTLSLKEKGSSSPIKLMGINAQKYFCRDAKESNKKRTCTLTPVTNVSPEGPFGQASATLRFEVGYL